MNVRTWVNLNSGEQQRKVWENAVSTLIVQKVEGTTELHRKQHERGANVVLYCPGVKDFL